MQVPSQFFNNNPHCQKRETTLLCIYLTPDLEILNILYARTGLIYLALLNIGRKHNKTIKNKNERS